jgi:hypothetical protein
VGGVFRARSILERWVLRDSQSAGFRRAEVAGVDYFEAYARYWEQFHISLAMSGMLAKPNCTVVPYGKEAMEGLASRFHARFAKEPAVEPFLCKGSLLDRHPRWIKRSEEAVRCVEAAWRSCGARFPTAEISSGE